MVLIGIEFLQKDFNTYPKVVLAMGAAYVQAVTSIPIVSTIDVTEFDYTVVDDGSDPIPYGDAHTVDTAWIKRCLITGVLWPPLSIS